MENLTVRWWSSMTDICTVNIALNKGNDGLTPYIKDGNWWIGLTDTGVQAEANSITGIELLGKFGLVSTYRISFTDLTYFDFSVSDGAQGDKGDKGDKGDDGLTTSIELNGTTHEQVGGKITLPNLVEQDGDITMNTSGQDVDEVWSAPFPSDEENYTLYKWFGIIRAKIDRLFSIKLDTSGNGSNTTVAFTESGTESLPATGETQATLWGKALYYIKKLNQFATDELAKVKQVTGTSTTDVMSQKAITDELGTKAFHGYANIGSAKTIKQVDDSLAQLAGEMSQITKSQAIQILKQYDSTLLFKGFAKSGNATPTATLNHAYIVKETGTVFGVAASQGQILVGDGSRFNVENISLKIEGKNYYYFISGFINSTGGVGYHADFACTEFIPINSNLDLKLTGYENGTVKLYALYDSGKSLISVNPGTTGNDQTITLTSIELKSIETSLSKKIAFIRCSKHIAQTTAEIFAANLPSLISYVNRTNDLFSLYSLIGDSYLKSEVFTKKEVLDLAHVEYGTNLFNKSDDDIVDGYYQRDEKGELMANPLFTVSGFIPVLPNTEYTFSKTIIRYLEFDEDKVPITSTFLLSPISPTFTTGGTAAYIRVTLSTALLNTQQLQLGDTVQPYEQFTKSVTHFNEIPIGVTGYYTSGQVDNLISQVSQTPIITLPSTLYAIVGKEFNLYYDQFIFCKEYGAGNPTVNVSVVCNKGKAKQRSYRFTPTIGDVGSYAITFNIYSDAGVILHTSSHTLIVVSNAEISNTALKIVMVGDSNTAANYAGYGSPIANYLQQNLAECGGNTPVFYGTYGANPHRNEGVSGADFSSILNGKNAKTKLILSGLIDSYPLSSDIATQATYSGGGTTYAISGAFVIKSDGSGYAICNSNLTSQTFPMSLSKTEGDPSMPETITVNSIVQIPSGYVTFKNSEGQGILDFGYYRNEVLRLGTTEYIDIFTVDLGLNDANGSYYNQDTIGDWYLTRAITFYNEIIADNPNAKVVFILPKMCGSGQDTTTPDNTYYRLNLFAIKKAIIETFDNNNLYPNAYVSQAGLAVDRYYGFPTRSVTIAARITGTMTMNSDAMHPSPSGYWQDADGLVGIVKYLADL